MAALIHRYRLVLLIAVLLLTGFSLNVSLSYLNAREEIHRGIIEQGLPLTGDTIYSEINKDILRPVFISSLMAHDTFVRDWLLGGEHQPQQVARYLQEVRLKYGTVSSFLVSDKSRRYYYGEGVLKQVSDHDPRDAWYQRVRAMKQDYEINVDVDMANRDAMTVFINHRIVDFSGRYIGATGVGLTRDKLSGLIDNYERRFNRRIYFADGSGRIVLGSGRNRVLAHSLSELPGLAPQLPQLLQKNSTPALFSYQAGSSHILLNARYIPDLGWYLLVEQDETEAMRTVEQTMHANLAISAAIMLLVISITLYTVNRHQRKLERMATTDQLTGCLNRHAFQEQWPRLARREQNAPLLLVDIDYFKQVNDSHGHLAGDAILQQAAALLQDQLHPQDLLVRWGGEEFLILPRPQAARASTEALAEGLRRAVADWQPQWQGHTLQITVSIGLCYWRQGESLDSATDRADRALYQAKQSGRNRVIIVNEES